MQNEYSDFMIGALTGLLTAVAALIAYRASDHQNRLTATGVAADWLRDLRIWASEAIDVMSEAVHICASQKHPNPERTTHELELCNSRISALIDRGRFLFPNEQERVHGEHKPSAYRGFRHPGLDALVAASRIIGGRRNLYAFPDAESALIHVKREFVSIVHDILDPRSMNRAVAAILRHSQEGRRKDPTLGGLLPDPENLPRGAEGLLITASLRYEEYAKKRNRN